jgi:hypothetical protein
MLKIARSRCSTGQKWTDLKRPNVSCVRAWSSIAGAIQLRRFRQILRCMQLIDAEVDTDTSSKSEVHGFDDIGLRATNWGSGI